MSRSVQPDIKPVVGIVGMACRFPGARNVDELWRLLADGAEGISSVSAAELAAIGIPEQVRHNSRYVKAIGRLPDVDKFDATFFDCTPRQAAELDPQQRFFLECAWEALEDAGCDPARFDGSIGVFAGAGPVRYALQHVSEDLKSHRLLELIQRTIGTDKDFLATRVSYKLDLRGPSLTVQTACSTSLVAIHLACQSLLSGDCDLALAGGVCIPVPHGCGYLYSEGGILSPDGHCRAFDAHAKGTVPSSGVGIVVLRRMEDAICARHNIYAAIRNSAVNNDGSCKVGFTAPSVDGQREVLEMALTGTDPRTLGMIEAHGTGTVLGDSVELTALTEVFSSAGAAPGSCALGSIKTNIGHPDAAAGVAGFMKAALCLNTGRLVPSLHFSAPNELLKTPDSPFFVNTESRPWAASATPRRAGVSSFGMGGTNAHVILEEVPQESAAAAETVRTRLFPLSAKSIGALSQLRQQLAHFILENPGAVLDDIAHTLQSGRRHFDCRGALVSATRDDLVAALQKPIPVAHVTTEPKAVVLHFDRVFHADNGASAAPCSDDPRWTAEYDDLISKFATATACAGTSGASRWEVLVAQFCNARSLLRYGIHPEMLVASGVGVLLAACLAGAIRIDDCVCLLIALDSSPGNDFASFTSLLRSTAISRPAMRLFLATGIELSPAHLGDPQFLHKHLAGSVHRGEFVSISGPSGCGKSTLLAIIGLLDTPTAGEYLLNGRAVSAIGLDERATIRNSEIGFIFQSFNLIGDLTVFENVELPLTYRVGMARASRRKAALEALERVGMAHRLKHHPSQLSGGQQQRVAVARALCGSPSVLLADEPTGNLDSQNGEAVMELLHALHAEGSTICMVTHDSRYADFAQRRLQLLDGRVRLETAEQFVRGPRPLVTN